MISRIPLLVIAIFATPLYAEDWPNWRGPSHNGISAEKGWKTDWPADGPPVLWKADVGIGFASFSVAGGRVYTTGHDKEQDTLFCFDAATGKEIWKHSYPAELGDKYYEGGTSATPTVSGNKVFHLSRWGDAMCLDAASGKVVWSKNVATETEAEIPDWGFAGSPLVLGDLVFLTVGKHGMAVAKSSGDVKWKSGTEPAGYATPLPFLGKPGQLLFSGAKAYFCVEESTGKPVWDYPWRTQYGVNAADPIVSDGQIFISSGYNKGCTLIKVEGNKPSKVWESKVMRTQFNSCVLVDGHLYGPDGNDGDKGPLKCLEWKTGKVKWERKGFGVGGVTVADGKLIALSARGELMVAPVSSEKFEPSSEAQVLGGRCWTTPVLANGRIYCRNAAGDVVCLDVKGK
jgi:outer membrane protein assembly factor BamB